jgi:hypothetical protein
MFARLSSLLMLFLLSLSALGGMPLHAPEFGECPMAGGMQQMDCCKKAQQQEMTSEVISAKFCCSLDCGGSGPASSSRTSTLSIQTQSASQPGGMASGSALPLPSFLTDQFAERPTASDSDHPLYIRHLALLI